jgi:hypothetical protein
MAKKQNRHRSDPPIPGRPGYRNRARRSGLDPMDSYQEAGYMQGLLIRNLFLLRLRTRNPFYLLLMVGGGALFLWPLVAALKEYIDTRYFNPGLFCFIPMGMMGLLFFINVILSLMRQ